MSTNELEGLAGKQVQAYIIAHKESDVQALLLQHKEIFGLPFGLIADQILARKKAFDKIPLLYCTQGIVYPPSLNLEQSSSQETALFKTRIYANELKGKDVADLTGGLGIDSLFMSKTAGQIEFIEPDEDLLRMARHNFRVLNIRNVSFHHASAEAFLSQNKTKFDLIYLDPSRRDPFRKKVFRLQDCSPNILELKDSIFESAELSLVKTSPLLDISQGLKEIPFVKSVSVVSIANECKELLFLAEKNFEGRAVINTFNLTKSESQEFSFYLEEETNATSQFSEPLDFLYEPNASILKSGAFKLIGEKFRLKKIHPNTHLYTSSAFVHDFPGRVFKIESVKPDFKKDLPEGKANVITRNYPIKPDELRKKLKLIDGGEKYVIGFTSARQKHVVLASRV